MSLIHLQEQNVLHGSDAEIRQSRVSHSCPCPFFSLSQLATCNLHILSTSSKLVPAAVRVQMFRCLAQFAIPRAPVGTNKAS